jgi:parvulin-like peptidyl-prolyl isomerase
VLIPVNDSSTDLPASIAAAIDQTVISVADLDRTVTLLATDSTYTSRTELRGAVLDRLIDEELLLGKARQLGMDKSDPSVRKALIAAMIESLNAESAGAEPTDEELADLFQREQSRFESISALKVRVLGLPAPRIDPAARRAAVTRLEQARVEIVNGADFADVRERYGAKLRIPVPEEMLSPSTLANLAGAEVAAAALHLSVDSVSDVVQSNNAVYLVEVLEARTNSAQQWGDVREQLSRLWKNEAQDRTLREYLDELRARAEVSINKPTAAIP